MFSGMKKYSTIAIVLSILNLFAAVGIIALLDTAKIYISLKMVITISMIAISVGLLLLSVGNWNLCTELQLTQDTNVNTLVDLKKRVEKLEQKAKNQ